jgi:GT2 family glycosyltransferase
MDDLNVVAYTSSLNDKKALRRCIDALLAQTYPLREIIVVDNRSSDGTSGEAFPEKVTLICHLRNLGTSGAAATAFQYALANDYKWVWVLDQDSIPRRDALERLVEFHQSFPPKDQTNIGILSSLVILDPERSLLYTIRLTPRGPRLVKVDPTSRYCECDATIWSGSLYRLEAVKKVGFPRFGVQGYWEDFCLDYGDIEFGYRIKQAGYKVLVHPSSKIDHCVGKISQASLLGRRVYTSNHPPFRRYLSFRNTVNFWLYIHPDRQLFPVLLFLAYRLSMTISTILLIEDNRTAKIWACIKGAWDGLRKKLHYRF